MNSFPLGASLNPSRYRPAPPRTGTTGARTPCSSSTWRAARSTTRATSASRRNAANNYGYVVNSTATNAKINAFICPSDPNAGQQTATGASQAPTTATWAAWARRRSATPRRRRTPRTRSRARGSSRIRGATRSRTVTDGTSNTVAFAEEIADDQDSNYSRKPGKGTGGASNLQAVYLLDVNTVGSPSSRPTSRRATPSTSPTAGARRGAAIAGRAGRWATRCSTPSSRRTAADRSSGGPAGTTAALRPATPTMSTPRASTPAASTSVRRRQREVRQEHHRHEHLVGPRHPGQRRGRLVRRLSDPDPEAVDDFRAFSGGDPPGGGSTTSTRRSKKLSSPAPGPPIRNMI